MKLGTNDITLKVGSVSVDAAYLGTVLVYSGGTPTPTGNTWVVYHSGDTVPTGVTFGGVRISSATTIDNGAVELTLTQNNNILTFGNDLICTNGECLEYPCMNYECAEYDEGTGECMREECAEYDYTECTNWDCTEWGDGFIIDDENYETITEGAFTFVDGYWTYNAEMTSNMDYPLAFDIELFVL